MTAAGKEEDDDIGSSEEEDEEWSDFVPSPYSRASLVAIEVEVQKLDGARKKRAQLEVHSVKVKRKAFSTPRNPSESRLIPIDEFGDTRWRLPDEGKTLKDYRMSHLLVYVGLIDFDLNVPPSCPAGSAQAESGKWWNTQNSSQPHKGAQVDATRCITNVYP